MGTEDVSILPVASRLVGSVPLCCRLWSIWRNTAFQTVLDEGRQAVSVEHGELRHVSSYAQVSDHTDFARHPYVCCRRTGHSFCSLL